MPKSLATPSTSELLIKKSRFIGCVQPVADRAAAQQVVAALRAQHPAGAHVCWALLAGTALGGGRRWRAQRHRRAAQLDVLRHQDLEGVLATVVRYYGGVKLGAGGLVRAYTDCIAQALPGAKKDPYRSAVHPALRHALRAGGHGPPRVASLRWHAGPSATHRAGGDDLHPA